MSIKVFFSISLLVVLCVLGCYCQEQNTFMCNEDSLEAFNESKNDTNMVAEIVDCIMLKVDERCDSTRRKILSVVTKALLIDTRCWDDQCRCDVEEGKKIMAAMKEYYPGYVRSVRYTFGLQPKD